MRSATTDNRAERGHVRSGAGLSFSLREPHELSDRVTLSLEDDDIVIVVKIGRCPCPLGVVVGRAVVTE